MKTKFRKRFLTDIDEKGRFTVAFFGTGKT